MNAAREEVADLVSLLRAQGFKGAGATFRKLEEEVMFVVTFQRSQDGSNLYINLGGQPTCIPDASPFEIASPAKLKAYDCVFRVRIGKQWSRTPSPSEQMERRTVLDRDLAGFRQRMLSLTARLRLEAPEQLARDLLPLVGHPAVVAFYLAQLCQAHGVPERLQTFIDYGLQEAGSAIVIAAKLRALRVVAS
jgi:hypothetical protein